jgi:hypothetical protein
MCFICGEITTDAEGHHMLLFSEDGPEKVQNIITLCKSAILIIIKENYR